MIKNYMLVFLISMFPLIELRGAIPVGLGLGLPILPTYLVCVVGNMIPVPFIYLFARKFLIWGYHKRKRRPRAGSQGRAWPGGGAAAVCGHPAAGHRCLDRYAGGLHPGYEI